MADDAQPHDAPCGDDAPSPADAFEVCVHADPIPLDTAALCIAAHCRRCDVDTSATLGELERLANAVVEPTPGAVVDLLFGVEGFAGNRGNYQDPSNSYLDLVVARRRGIPITLAVVAIEVGRRAGVWLHGVGMPGHFLVGTTDPDVFIDAFDGRFVDRSAAQDIFGRFESRQAFNDNFLSPTPSSAILLRMLNNLRVLHMRSADATSLVAVLELVTRLAHCPASEFMRLGQALAALGRPDDGARSLEAAAERFGAAEATQMQSLARRLWAQLN